jgi:phage-related baseplate assembly protein
VGPPVGEAELASLPLGRRDALLLRLRSQLAGETLEATAACPACGEVVEFAAAAGALLAREGDPAPPQPVELDGFVVEWRPPDSRDVAAAAEAGDEAGAERVLLARCVTSAAGPDGALDAAALPAAVRGAVAEAMAAADPLAEVLVDVVCPACERAFVADLDVAGFVWAEIREEARRLLHEVDVLARAYGWTEAEVLALGRGRRAAYLRLAREGAP